VPDLLSPAVRRVAAVAFALYLVVLVGVAFFPLPGEPRPGTEGVVPLDLSLSRPDLLGGWEAQRNVLMTVPFGVLLPLVVRWRYEWLLLACVGVTLVIETGQLLGSLDAMQSALRARAECQRARVEPHQSLATRFEIMADDGLRQALSSGASGLTSLELAAIIPPP